MIRKQKKNNGLLKGKKCEWVNAERVWKCERVNAESVWKCERVNAERV
jgi:hypothetical protein